MLRTISTSVCLSLLGLVCGAASAQTSAPPAGSKPPFTITADERGTWSFTGPEGNRFVSLGIDNASPEPYNPRPGTDYYNPVPTQFKGDVDAWGTWTRDLLIAHGFNTAGAWSSPKVATAPGFYHTPILYLGATPFHQCLDAFRQDFSERAERNAAKVLAAYPDKSKVMGVFLDNEMPWWGRSGWDRTTNYTLLERAFEESPTEPARVAALEFLKGRYPSAAVFAKACEITLDDWNALSADTLRVARGESIAKDRTEFIGVVAERYFKLGTDAVRKVAPGVLILGSRFAGDVPDPVAVACGKYCDVVSFNDYHGDPTSPDDLIARYWLMGKKPLMITEFAWRAKENASGCPNTAGAGGVVGTQADRADRYGKYAKECLSSPIIVGLHWFEFADQSPQGRFDGENSNYGIVSIRNEPYKELLGAMKTAHADVPRLRSGTLKPVPTKLVAPVGLTYAPGQHPGRPPTVDLLGASPTQELEVWGAPDAKLDVKREGAALVLSYNAGAAYGAGINMYGPKASRVPTPPGPSFATDLDGYTDFAVDINAPKGLQLNLVLTEAGSGPVGQTSYPSTAGDDGEAFISDAFYGTGEKHTYRIRIADLKKQTFWGNQSGNNMIQMAAVKCFGLQLQGSPVTGTVRVEGTRLER